MSKRYREITNNTKSYLINKKEKLIFKIKEKYKRDVIKCKVKRKIK